MTIKEIHTRAGSIWSYGGYIFLMFCYYFAFNRFDALQLEMPENTFLSLADWGLRILVAPLMLAGVFGGIYEQQRTREEWDLGAFLEAVRTHYWRITGANLLSIVTVMGTGLAVIFVLLFAGVAEPVSEENGMLWGLVGIPVSAVMLFWFAGVVVERRVFRTLGRSLRTLLFNPFALAIGLVWGLISFVDTAGVEALGTEPSLALDGLRSAALAVARVLAAVYAISFYRQGWEETVDREAQEATLSAEPSAASAGGWITASFVFAFLSFLPLVHLAALTLGIVALKRAGRFVTRAAIACALGGFFTFFYVYLVSGWVLGGSVNPAAPGYAFLSQENPAVERYVTLLDQGSYQDVQQQLGAAPLNSPARHWTFDFTLALAKWNNFNLDGALDDFRTAAEKEPERSEFYYYYGLALLQNEQPTMAERQFNLALEHAPRLAQAERYVTLLESAYEPSQFMSALLFIVILLVLFTVHEYGHAYAAWKLGDDTAKNQGRLTLNPIPHLDLFGSILLPALLLWQQSTVLFGWAKPVPVDPRNFKDPLRDHMRVSFAGPAMNFLISLACFVLLGLILLALRLFWPETVTLNVSAPFAATSIVGPPFARWLLLLVVFLKQLLYTSLVLGVFNLIPIPPLDGSWILSGLLPQRLRSVFEAIRPYAYLVFLLLIVTSALDIFLSLPMSLAWTVLELAYSAWGFG